MSKLSDIRTTAMSALILSLILGSCSTNEINRIGVDTLHTNAEIYTSDPAGSSAEAFAVTGTDIVYVGQKMIHLSQPGGTFLPRTTTGIN